MWSPRPRWIAVEANSSPQFARTGPPHAVTTSVRYRPEGRKRVALREDFQRTGDVEDLCRVEGRDDDAWRAHRGSISPQ